MKYYIIGVIQQLVKKTIQTGTRRSFYLKLIPLFVLLFSSQAQAIPAFARSTNLNCVACHTAFPSLNETGREFKTNGYRIDPVSDGVGPSDFSKSVAEFPASAAIISRPYTKDKGGNSEVRAIHELELFVGGVLYQNLSGFVEIESEGEDGFGDVLGTAAINYDANDALHFQVAYGPTFFADPYDTLSDSRRLTAAHYNMWNSTYGNADNSDKLRHSRQQVSVFGRTLGNRFFYNVGFGGLTGDNVANESTVAFGRVAFDFTPGIMVGAFDVEGSCKVGTTSDFANCGGATRDLDFRRAGIDAQVDVGNMRLTAVYLKAKDDLAATMTSESNNNIYAQLTYYGMAGERLLVPLIRFENSEVNDGKDDVSRFTVGLSYYFLRNFKGSLEYGKDTSVPAGESKGNNFTFQLEAAF